jgi:hypothetical protein
MLMIQHPVSSPLNERTSLKRFKEVPLMNKQDDQIEPGPDLMVMA